MTARNKPTTPNLPRLIQFYHPIKGGLYYATLVKQGRKWATVQHLSRTKRIPVTSIKADSKPPKVVR